MLIMIKMAHVTKLLLFSKSGGFCNIFNQGFSRNLLSSAKGSLRKWNLSETSRNTL